MTEAVDSTRPDRARYTMRSNHVVAGAIVFDSHGLIESVDQSVAHFLGHDATTLSGRSATVVVAEQDGEAWLPPRDKALKAPVGTVCAIALCRQDGSRLGVQATISDISISGMCYTVVTVIADADACETAQGHWQANTRTEANSTSSQAIEQGAHPPARVAGTPEMDSLQSMTRDLVQSRRDFEALADTVPGIIWTAAPTGVVDFANRELLDRCGMSIADLTSTRWREFFHPEDQERTAAAWHQAMVSGAEFVLDTRLYCRHDQCYRWHALRARPVLDDAGCITKWFGSALDIHDERELQAELELTAARLTHTLESITDGLMTVDHDWRVRYFNREAERVFQVPRDQLLGQFLASVFPGCCGSQFQCECARAMASGQTRHFELHLESIDLWLEVHAYPSSDGLTIYFRDIGERKRAEAEIEFLAFRDPLTSLPNRRRMLQRLEKALGGAESRGCYSGVLLVDCDNFKCLNDSLGHEAADAVIQAIGQRLHDCFNAEDTVARIGGDEFALVLPDIGTSAVRANSRIHEAHARIVDVMRQVGDADGDGLRKTCSVGADVIAPGARDAGETMKRADLALFGAKQAGGNQFRLFDESMRVRADAWATSEIEIPRAIEAGEFVPHYQPKLAGDGCCIGAEALIRWHHPERGLVEPDAFVPMAEESGVIKRLGKLFLHDVCVDIARWAHMPAMRDRIISINVSPSQLHEPGFVDDVARILEQTGAPASRLRIEVTETMLMQDIDAVVATMDALKKLGIAFSLDDFGTGHSALAYLKRLPLAEVKIDQGFVKDIDGDESSRAIIQSIVALATSLDMEVVAEGVETWAMHDGLVAEGCRYFQGYLFGPPMSAREFGCFPQWTRMGPPALLNQSA